MADFTHIVDRAFPQRSLPRVRSYQFNDAYQARTADGINNIGRVWNVKFDGRRYAEVTAIEDFFEARTGSVPFSWEDPVTNIEYNVVCTQWGTVTVSSQHANITATFEEDHA